MKLDTKSLRFLNAHDWRVLTAVETGARNHEVVPTPLIVSLARSGSGAGTGDVNCSISVLAKAGLIARVKQSKYDGYRFTYGGADYLALHALQKAGHVYSVGNQIGIGKESDIFVVADEQGTQRVLKIHRLGRVSFKKGVKAKRDYLKGGRKSAGSWMYMSRLAAHKEWSFLQALHDSGVVRVPQPIGWNRHHVLMEFVDGLPLRMVDSMTMDEARTLYAELMEMIVRLAGRGLIHGDFNEFNILIVERESKTLGGKRELEDGMSDEPDIRLEPVLIDFPQMVSVDHPDAEFYFDRDVACVKRYFERRFSFVSDEPGPFFKEAKSTLDVNKRLDVAVEASGFSRKMAKELEKYMKEHGIDGDGHEADELRDVEEGESENDSDSENEGEGDTVGEDANEEENEDDGENEKEAEVPVP